MWKTGNSFHINKIAEPIRAGDRKDFNSEIPGFENCRKKVRRDARGPGV